MYLKKFFLLVATTLILFHSSAQNISGYVFEKINEIKIELVRIMNKNILHNMLIPLLVFLGFMQCSSVDSKKINVDKNNVILIFADDLGYRDVGFMGCQDTPTPNIDALANNGVRFSNAYVTCPVCAPSRAGLMTGRYQNRFGFEDNPGPFRQSADVVPGIPRNEKIMAEYSLDPIDVEKVSTRSSRVKNSVWSSKLQPISAVQFSTPSGR